MLTVLNIVSPVFLVMAVGQWLRSRHLVTQDSVGVLSWIVFYVATPALLFRSIATTPVERSLDPWLVGSVFTVTLATATVVYFFTSGVPAARRGVATQGIFRSNMVFVGLPVVINAFGNDPGIMGPVSTMIGLTVPLYNLLAVPVLLFPHRHDPVYRRSLRRILGDIARNPLILSSLMGVVYSLSGAPVPGFLNRTLSLMEQSASPLALLVVGASLDFRKWPGELFWSLIISAGKLVFYPAFFFLAIRLLAKAGWMTIGDIHKATLLVLAAPTAVAAHIMAREMGGDERLSASVVVSSTVLSLFSISGWIAFLQWVG